MPYLMMIRSAKVSGRARQYGPYKHVAIVEIEPGLDAEPTMISERARGVRRVVRDSGGVWAGGKTDRAAWPQVVADFRAECDHLNRLERYELAPLVYPVTLEEIDAEANEERRRELIERYRGRWDLGRRITGLQAYLEAARAVRVHEDEHGRLWRREPAAGEPIVAVEVTDPSTGRVYMLRVPPSCSTAHEAVAWTFGFDLRPEQYQPVVAA